MLYTELLFQMQQEVSKSGLYCKCFPPSLKDVFEWHKKTQNCTLTILHIPCYCICRLLITEEN